MSSATGRVHMLSQTVEYALRAMVCLAGKDGQPQTRTDLVRQTRVPSAYLAKVMKGLNRAGLVSAQRGLHGGFRLARSSEEISLLAVVNAVEPIRRIESCPLGIRTHGSNLCALHRRLDQAIAYVESAFAETTLADIVTEKTGSTPLCDDARPQDTVQLG